MIHWLTADCLHPQGPAFRRYPDAPAIFVFDDARLDWSLQRIGFVYECLLELPCVIHRGDPVEEVAGFAIAHGAAKIVTTASLEVMEQRQAEELSRRFEVEIVPPDPFVEVRGHLPLGRFSRYWKKVEPLLTR